ncbi:hypothetical protein F0562_006444 [Nyssa sinensis]|uniref:Uncharacterized protein n=1 Tax=Nyssa sinensis TaxID=561372 RepID=A0A5J5AM81_9ASTE|nr:hypothetical protein F0562_006444 [Nyssa sinensis]
MSGQQNRSLGWWADDDRTETAWDAVVAGYNGDNSAAMAMGVDETLGDDETLCDSGEYWYEASLMTIGIASLDFGGRSDRWV